MCFRSRTVTLRLWSAAKSPVRGRAEPLSASVRMSLRETPSARSARISVRIAWLAWFWAATSVAPVPWVENEIVPWSGRMVTDPLPVKRMNGCSMPPAFGAAAAGADEVPWTAW